MGQAVLGHAGHVSATSRHAHCPRVSLAGALPREPTVGPRARTRASLADATEPSRLAACDFGHVGLLDLCRSSGHDGAPGAAVFACGVHQAPVVRVLFAPIHGSKKQYWGVSR